VKVADERTGQPITVTWNVGSGNGTSEIAVINRPNPDPYPGATNINVTGDSDTYGMRPRQYDDSSPFTQGDGQSRAPFPSEQFRGFADAEMR
jgi:hypothetical protein